MSERGERYAREHFVMLKLTPEQMEKLRPLHKAVTQEPEPDGEAGPVLLIQLHNEAVGKAFYFPHKYGSRIRAVVSKCFDEMAKEETKRRKSDEAH